jgi:predicted dehydrogenase
MPVPDSFHITLRFDDGSLALLEFSYALRGKEASYIRLLAVGEKGTLQHNSETEAGLTGTTPQQPSPATENAMFLELSHWVKTLQGQAEPIVKLTEVRSTLQAALGAQQSLATGKPVMLGVI